MRSVPLASAALALVAVTASLIGACGNGIEPRDTSLFPDAGSEAAPPPPRVDMVATKVPWPVVTIRGTAREARRVIVDGVGNPVAITVLPDNSFCVDVPLPTPEMFDLRIRSQSRAGLYSESAAMATVTFDPGAAPIPGATTCDGGDPAGCAGASEICDNSRDDDCNGLSDDQDPACRACTDDSLEPNDDLDAPRLDPGRYEALVMCPGTTDYYGVFLRAGDELTARIFFVHANGDLELELLAPDFETRVASSGSITDDESLTFVATAEGEHKLRVVGADLVGNDYAMNIAVVSGE